MWHPALITTPAVAEPVTLEQAKAQSRVVFTNDDTLINRLIAAARSHVEAYCGTRLASQTVSIKCDGFSDFARLSESPVQSVSSVSYVDSAGATQTLSTDVYELRSDGLEAAIVLKYGQAWPSIRQGSRITVAAVVGYAAVPPAIAHAMLLLIGAWYESREESVIGIITSSLPASVSFDALLSNFRRGV